MRLLKTIGLRLEPHTLSLVNKLSKKMFVGLEKNYGLDFSESSLLIRVAIGNMFLNTPTEEQMDVISSSLKDNKTFHAFLKKIAERQGGLVDQTM